jgi:RNA polymerase-binding transcription factor DksA
MISNKASKNNSKKVAAKTLPKKPSKEALVVNSATKSKSVKPGPVKPLASKLIKSKPTINNQNKTKTQKSEQDSLTKTSKTENLKLQNKNKENLNQANNGLNNLNNKIGNNAAPNELNNVNHLFDPGFLSNDEVFDETDQAQYLQLMEQAAIAQRARNMNAPETHPDFDGEHCIDCDVSIPKPRLAHGKIRCFDCQSYLEEVKKRTGG